MIPLGLVPAKGHSERLPGKNLRLLGGKSLLRWTLEPARASGLFGAHLWVSSEDDRVLAEARQAGAEALRRPRALAESTTTVLDVVEHARQALEWRGPIYVLLPTSPFRRPETIQAAWTTFTAHEPVRLLSVSPMAHQPAWSLIQHAEGWLIPAFPALFDTPRSELPGAYYHDGGHQILSVEALQGMPVPFRAFPTPADELVDITTLEDLEWAEWMLSRRPSPSPA